MTNRTTKSAARATPSVTLTSRQLSWLVAFEEALLSPDAETALDDLGRMMSAMLPLNEELMRRLWLELAVRGARGVLGIIACAEGEERDGSREKSVMAPCNPALGRALQCIHASLSNPDLSVDRVAGATGVSRRWLCHLFSLHLRVSIMDTVHALRIYRAAEALRSTRMSTKEVTFYVGYRRTSDLDAHFRKLTGLTPTSYRRAPALHQLGLLLGLGSPVRDRAQGGHRNDGQGGRRYPPGLRRVIAS